MKNRFDMEFETQAYNSLKKYLESLGYPNSSIFPEYNLLNSKIDAVVKSKDKILIAVEIKETAAIKSIATDEIGYHPITRKLQKVAIELNAKYYLLSDGKQNLWLKTGQNGRPEKTIAVQFNQFHTHTLSEFEFTKELLIHITEYIRNFPLTGDHLYDVSIVLYAKLIQDLNGEKHSTINFQNLSGTHHIHEKLPSSYSSDTILKEALERLKDIDLLENRITVFEFIDSFFEASRKQWNVPRWMADLMVALIDKDKQTNILDLFSRNGVFISSAYLREFQNITAYYTSHNELYWIKIQQILGRKKESEVKFEPGLLKGNLKVLSQNSMDAVLLAPTFNLKFEKHIDSYLGRQGLKDGNTLFLEAALNTTNQDGQVIAIVPDGFLLSAQYKKARSYFQSQIEAIISLPDDAFKPYSSIKTSLLLLRKSDSKKQEKVFMAALKKVPVCNLLYKEYDSSMEAILQNLALYRTEIKIVASQNGFTVEKLNAENFHVTKYWLDQYAQPSGTVKSDFSILPLKELIKSISRGNAIVNDIDGDIPCISPAVIRELQLSKEELSFTSKEKLPRGKIHRVVANDILVNIIGLYRGKAALVSKDFEEMLVNRHIAIIKPHLDFILPGYLAIALNSQFVQAQFRDQTSGTVIPALNLSSFDHIVIPVPSMETQQKIHQEFILKLDELAVIQAKAAILKGEITKRLSNLSKEGDKL